jgi:hypothetical protein
MQTKSTDKLLKEIPEFPGYFVTRDGEVFRNKNGILRQLQVGLYADNQYKIGLYKNRRQHTRNLGRLVALAWIPNPNNYQYVYHYNNDSTDNRVENLYWSNYINPYTRNPQLNRGPSRRRTKTKKIISNQVEIHGVVYKNLDEAAAKLDTPRHLLYIALYSKRPGYRIL